MEYTQRVREFVVDNFLFGDGGDLEDGTSFLKSGIIDSTGILELISFLENTFKVTVHDEETIPENLGSIAAIASYLKRKCNGNQYCE